MTSSTPIASKPDLVETVARAIAKELFGDDHAWRTVIDEAQAAITAIPSIEVVEALEFYARENTWRSCTVYMCGHGAIHCNAMSDKGDKARAALAKVKTDE